MAEQMDDEKAGWKVALMADSKVSVMAVGLAAMWAVWMAASKVDVLVVELAAN